jgi:release factor glutamine methyltransferase
LPFRRSKLTAEKVKRERATTRPLLGESLAWGRSYLAERGVPSADLDAQLLLAHTIGCDRSRLFSGSDQEIEGEVRDSYRQLVRERGERAPLAFLVGRREFWSLDFVVDERVLVPRPETEGIVEAARDLLRPGCRVVDVGTGSGNIIVAVASEMKRGEWHAVDISRSALEVAAANIRTHGLEGKVSLACSDLLDVFDPARESFDAILSNPPYIPSAEIDRLQPEVVGHEPRIALDGGADGLGVVRRLVNEAATRLRPGGIIIMEVGEGQAAVVREMMTEQLGYRRTHVRRDLAGIERIVVGERKGQWRA